jgi:hypothetical protein
VSLYSGYRLLTDNSYFCYLPERAYRLLKLARESKTGYRKHKYPTSSEHCV